MTYILGINCYGKHSAASLIGNDKIIAAVEEERFTKVKGDKSFPFNAIKYCLKSANISINQINHFGFFMNPNIILRHRINFIMKHLPQSLNLLSNQGGIKKLLDYYNVFNEIEKRFKTKINKQNCHFLEHHLCHAASTYYLSGFDESLILTADGCGEKTTLMIAYATNNSIKKIREIYYPNSLGFIYAAFTHFLGFEYWKEEGKVMSLASYGNPNYLKKMKKVIKYDNNGGFNIDEKYFQFHKKGWNYWFSDKFYKEFGKQRVKNESITQRHKDIAASLQKTVEIIVLKILEFYGDKTKSINLSAAGGLMLNSVLNGKIIQKTKFKHLFIQPAANDAGTSLGAALLIYYNILNRTSKISFDNPYLGPEYSEKEIEICLKEENIIYKKVDNIEKKTANLIAKGNIVGWFQGRMEFGPRALGNRSILADPRNKKMKKIINKKIKHRAEYQPFAPSIIEEKTNEYFNKFIQSPYMLLTYPLNKNRVKKIPAVIHVDSSARLQTVNKKTNSKYYKLIKEFWKITKIPILLNTSFNDKNQPIVMTPKDALNSMKTTNLDYLIISNFIIKNE